MILLNNNLYYDLLKDPSNIFSNEKIIFKNINNLNEKSLKLAMENNGGLITDNKGNPTGFYLAQLFRREPIHKYVIIINKNSDNIHGIVDGIINIGNNAYYTSNQNADDFYNNNNLLDMEIVNASNQSIVSLINQKLYEKKPGIYFDNSYLATEKTHYVFNKCWKNSYYHFYEQTKNPNYENFEHFYLFGF